jgi:hypothetical protein
LKSKNVQLRDELEKEKKLREEDRKLPKRKLILEDSDAEIFEAKYHDITTIKLNLKIHYGQKPLKNSLNVRRGGLWI